MRWEANQRLSQRAATSGNRPNWRQREQPTEPPAIIAPNTTRMKGRESMRRRASSPVRLAGIVVTALAGAAVLAAWSPPPASTTMTPASAVSALSIPGRGASVPFTEYEAEDAATNGTVLASSRTVGVLAAEASGRQAVTLSGPGRYVEFTLAEPANAVTVRYSISDSADGSGLTAPLGVYVN